MSVSVQAIANGGRLPHVADWVERAARGDLAAWEELYRTHVGRVHAICLRMTADRDRAEDLTQETFVRAWRKLDSFRGEAAFATWLTRLAVNVVLSDGRSRRRRQDREDDLGFEAGDGARRDPGLGLDLDHAIAKLPERARAVFVLHDVEGYRHEEIGRLMAITAGTSKAQLHRARKLLRETLS